MAHNREFWVNGWLTKLRRKFTNEKVKKLHNKILALCNAIDSRKLTICGISFVIAATHVVVGRKFWSLNYSRLMDVEDLLVKYVRYVQKVESVYGTIEPWSYLEEDGHVLSMPMDKEKWVIDRVVTHEILNDKIRDIIEYGKCVKQPTDQEKEYFDFLDTTPFKPVLLDYIEFLYVPRNCRGLYFNIVLKLKCDGRPDLLMRRLVLNDHGLFIPIDIIHEVSDSYIKAFRLYEESYDVVTVSLRQFRLVGDDTVRELVRAIYSLPKEHRKIEDRNGLRVAMKHLCCEPSGES